MDEIRPNWEKFARNFWGRASTARIRPFRTSFAQKKITVYKEEKHCIVERENAFFKSYPVDENHLPQMNSEKCFFWVWKNKSFSFEFQLCSSHSNGVQLFLILFKENVRVFLFSRFLNEFQKYHNLSNFLKLYIFW
jgi:hypothetical protein